MSDETFFSKQTDIGCISNVILCIFLASIYVGSLYIWPNNYGRDHPVTIKKRFLSVFVISIVTAVIVYFHLNGSYLKFNLTYWSLLGLRTEGLLLAFILPLFLTMVLFLGPIALHYNDGMYNKFFDLELWKRCLTSVIWLRNHLVAPFFEEFSFRACMLPILVPCFGNGISVILCPLFFGIAHLHLLNEKLAQGIKLNVAIFQSLFQFMYTTVFGAYSTYLFLRTGHFVAPFVAHAFCNHMGFPDFDQLLTLKQPKKCVIMCCFVLGLISWMLLLQPLTNPVLYRNTIYWSH